MTEYEFTVVIEKDEDGRFVAICPALQGCYTEGETEAEASELVKDAIRLVSRIDFPRVNLFIRRLGQQRFV